MKKEDLKVGDTIYDTYTPASQGYATVTEITARGFKYDLHKQFNLGARFGYFTDGEAFLDDEYLQNSCRWELVDK